MVGYNLTCNCWTRLKRLAGNKHSSLFIWSVSDENKKLFFYLHLVHGFIEDVCSKVRVKRLGEKKVTYNRAETGTRGQHL
jgi:hypothetical protein